MLIIENQKYFDEVVAFAKRAGLYEGENNACLKSRIEYLEKYGGKSTDGSDRMRVRLSRDSSPYCFVFVIEEKTADGEWHFLFNGGLLYHGSHDGCGSGAAPTFAVTLESTTGWSIHT